MKMPVSILTLAIESAVGGGSIALFRGPERIDGLVGPSGVSRAEDLLPNIDKLLINNDLNKLSIGSMVVGAGPGSFTGIRIGIATALGLGAALNVPVRKFSTLEAIVLAADKSGDITAALPVGRDTVCMQLFKHYSGQVKPESHPTAISNEEFADLVRTDKSRSFVVNRSIFDSSEPIDRAGLTDVGDDLAAYLGRFAGELTQLVEPLFIGKRK